MKNKFIYFSLFLCLVLMSFQNVDTGISGKITDSSGQALIGAIVVLYDSEGVVNSTISDVEGHYSFSQLDLGEYAVEVTYAGYQAQRITNINLTQGVKEFVSISLKEGPALRDVVVTCGPSRSRFYYWLRNVKLGLKKKPVPVIEEKHVYQKSLIKGKGKILGKLVDKETGEPLLVATVALYRNGSLLTGTDSDFDGNYFMTDIETGYYRIEASYVGYSNVSVSDIIVNEDEVTTVDISMVESPIVHMGCCHSGPPKKSRKKLFSKLKRKKKSRH